MEEQEPPKILTPRERQLAGLKHVQKGQVLNPKGKKPGTLNRVNQQTKELLALALERNMPEVDKAITQLLRSENETTRLRAIEIITRLLEFTTPRLSATAVKAEGSGNIIVVGKPSDLELPPHEDPIVENAIEEASILDNNLSEDMDV
jgi:hypothetical protein